MKPRTPNEDGFPEFKSAVNISAVSPPSHALHDLIESVMNDSINGFGLSEWKVLWVPDPTQHARGQILPEAKTIIIYNEKAEDAMETLLHEFLEIKLRPMLRPYRTLVNALIEWADQQVYAAKEKTINDLLPFLIKFNEEEHSSQKNLEEVRTDLSGDDV